MGERGLFIPKGETQRGIRVLEVERKPALSGSLPQKGDIFGGTLNNTGVVQMADLREQFPLTEEATV